jgi:glycosyltransferase involved in cell wall biosynthesis
MLENKLIIVVTSYNVGKYIERCLESIKNQTYENFKCYITDDLSTDDSVEKIKKIISQDNRFFLIENKEKRYQCGNYDLICRETEKIDDEDIVIEVDGDDYLSSDDVFNRIVDYYKYNNIWIANGSFIFESGGKGFTKEITDLTKIRVEPFTASHIRTWKVFLWRAIDVNDLKDENGNWWTAGGDLIFMYDMLEMAGLEHYKHMYEVNYVYNDSNPISDGRIHLEYVNKLNKLINNKKPKERLIR